MAQKRPVKRSGKKTPAGKAPLRSKGQKKRGKTPIGAKKPGMQKAAARGKTDSTRGATKRKRKKTVAAVRRSQRDSAARREQD